jgi:hypothetical protein
MDLKTHGSTGSKIYDIDFHLKKHRAEETKSTYIERKTKLNYSMVEMVNLLKAESIYTTTTLLQTAYHRSKL